MMMQDEGVPPFYRILWRVPSVESFLPPFRPQGMEWQSSQTRVWDYWNVPLAMEMSPFIQANFQIGTSRRLELDEMFCRSDPARCVWVSS
jgi:hypothetical protein